MTTALVPGDPQTVTSGVGTATASCPPDAFLVGGGGAADGTDSDPAFNPDVVGSWPSRAGVGGTWSFRATEAGGIEGGGPFVVTAYAVCVS